MFVDTLRRRRSVRGLMWNFTMLIFKFNKSLLKNADRRSKHFTKYVAYLTEQPIQG